MRLSHLLDIETVSDLVIRPQGKVAAAIAERGEASVCTSVVVAAELRYGAVKRGSARLTHQVEAILSAVRILPSRSLPTGATPSCAPTWTAPERRSARTTCSSRRTRWPSV